MPILILTESKPLAGEQTHWYDDKGNPCYTVKGKNGQDRDTTLRDARKMGLYPSVTSIIALSDKPGLTNWKIDQAILAALTLPRRPEESEAEWLARVKQDAKEQARKAAERGTAIHAAIESYMAGDSPDTAYLPFCGAATSVLAEQCGPVQWFAERSFTSVVYGYGGKVDLHNHDWVVDFKTKEFGPDDKLSTWAEHHMQLAAYREGLKIPEARCAIVYVSANNPGIARFCEVSEDDLNKGWMCFTALRDFWQASKGYKPRC